MDPIKKLFSNHQLSGLQEESHTPLYHQLYSLMRNAIVNGTLEQGEQMPTELQLAEAFSVSRITAKRALDELAAEKLVDRRRGKGTHVTYAYKPHPVQAPLVEMLQEIESMARHTDVVVRELDKLQPPADVRTELDIAAGDTALRIVRIRSRDGAPFAHYTSWTTGLTAPITKAQLVKTPRLEIFRKQGLHITHVTQTLSAVAASAEVAEELGMLPGAPLLSLVRRSYNKTDKQEVMVDFLQALYHPDRFQYQMDLKIDSRVK